MFNQTNLFFIFLTGLTTGGLTCLATQGSLLSSVLIPRENKTQESKIIPLTSFLIAKLISHTLLGFLLGSLGSVFTLSPITRGWFQIAIAIYLSGVALSLLNVHPVFRYFIFTPPRFISRFLKNKSQQNGVFVPSILGFFTIFIPCATTQAIEVIALGTSNPFYGAAIMAAFVLGSSPSFLLLGLLFNTLNKFFHRWFIRISVALLIVMSLFTFNNALSLMGSIYTFQNFYDVFMANLSGRDIKMLGISARQSNSSQEINISVQNHGYSPQSIILKKGVPAKVYLQTNNTQGCARAFTIPSLNIQKILPTSGTEIIEFTPNKSGPLVFSCTMGMYTGVFNVI